MLANKVQFLAQTLSYLTPIDQDIRTLTKLALFVVKKIFAKKVCAADHLCTERGPNQASQNQQILVTISSPGVLQ